MTKLRNTEEMTENRPLRSCNPTRSSRDDAEQLRGGTNHAVGLPSTAATTSSAASRTTDAVDRMKRCDKTPREIRQSELATRDRQNIVWKEGGNPWDVDCIGGMRLIQQLNGELCRQRLTARKNAPVSSQTSSTANWTVSHDDWVMLYELIR